MTRIQIQLKEEQMEWLRQKAKEKNTSISQLIREGVDLIMKKEEMSHRQEKKKRVLELVGRFSSGVSDVSYKHDIYLTQAYGEG